MVAGAAGAPSTAGASLAVVPPAPAPATRSGPNSAALATQAAELAARARAGVEELTVRVIREFRIEVGH